MSTTKVDVAIAGAGLAGSAAAFVLERRGLRVALVDVQSKRGTCFKAEKIEPDQAALLRRHGLLESVRAVAGSIRRVRNGRGEHWLDTVETEQYGAPYDEIVNAVRGALPPTVAFREARVDEITTGADLQELVLSTGERLSARLAIVATGTSAALSERLGLQRRLVRRGHSVSFGFDVAPAGGGDFPFDSIGYGPASLVEAIDYLSLFRMRTVMRANLFTYRDPRDPWVRELAKEPRPKLARVLPGLVSLVGDYVVTSGVDVGAVDLFVVEEPVRAGVVLLGDAFQSVCPATGTGLSKVLTDVDVLAQLAPGWFATPGLAAEKVATFYVHPRKAGCDRLSLGAAQYRRKIATDPSPPWQLRRMKQHLGMRLRALRRYGNGEPSARGSMLR